MKNEIIVVGAGGHAKVCIELLHAMGEKVSYCIGNEDSPADCLGIPVLHGDHHLNSLREQGYSRIFIAVGANGLRERLATLAMNYGYQLVNAISPQAIISPSVHLGLGIAIMAGVVINAETKIVDLAIINTGATVDHDCHIGRAAHVAPQCALAGNVFVGSQSFLGIGCKVIPEIKIGDKVTVGAGTVLISNIKNGLTVVGVPARILNKSIVEKEYHATNICRTA
jgi:UDP-perosamine 4-acetyltransferase